MNEKINRYILRTKFWYDICAELYGSLLNRSRIESNQSSIPGKDGGRVEHIHLTKCP